MTPKILDQEKFEKMMIGKFECCECGSKECTEVNKNEYPEYFIDDEYPNFNRIRICKFCGQEHTIWLWS